MFLKTLKLKNSRLFGHPAVIREAHASTYVTEDFVKNQSICEQIKLSGLGVKGKTSGQCGLVALCWALQAVTSAEVNPLHLASWPTFSRSCLGVEQWAQQHWRDGGRKGGSSLYLWCSCVLNEPLLQLLSCLANELMKLKSVPPNPCSFHCMMP